MFLWIIQYWLVALVYPRVAGEIGSNRLWLVRRRPSRVLTMTKLLAFANSQTSRSGLAGKPNCATSADSGYDSARRATSLRDGFSSSSVRNPRTHGCPERLPGSMMMRGVILRAYHWRRVGAIADPILDWEARSARKIAGPATLLILKKQRLDASARMSACATINLAATTPALPHRLLRIHLPRIPRARTYRRASHAHQRGTLHRGRVHFQ